MFEGRKKRDKNEFLEVKQSLAKEDPWIEGCTISTLEMRFATADTIIYLSLPHPTCIWRVCKRMLASNVHLSETGCLNGVN